MQQAEIRHMLAAASQAQREGRPDEAERLYKTVLKGGEQPVALNALGVRALGRGDPETAAGLFRRAIAADSSSPELCMNLAKAQRSMQDDVGERTALEGALAIDQRHFMALVRLAELLERTGEEARAAERWSGVLAMSVAMDERGPAIEEMLEHARDFVTRQRVEFGRAVDEGLTAARAGVAGEERRRFDACVDHFLGRRQIWANHCHGLHFPFLPADEFFDRRHFPWLGEIEAKTDVIRTELEALIAEGSPGFHPYVEMEPGTPANKWSELDHKLDWSAFHLWRHGKRDEAACVRCPETAAAIEATPLAHLSNRSPNVFFSLLRPGTHLPAHTGVSNVRAIIHLPLIVPPGCAFRVGGETREWRVGEAFAFDDTIEHEAWNRSDRLRVVLIFDTWNPHLTPAERELLGRLFPVADRHGYDSRARIGD